MSLRRLTVPLALLVALLAAPAADAAIKTRAGVRAEVFARGLGQPTNVAFDPAGGVWTTSGGNVTARSDGVWYVRRRGARPVHAISRLYSALGLAWYRGELYVTHVVPYSDAASRWTARVTAFSGFDGRRFKRRRTVVSGLPTGRHRINSIVAGHGGRLYVGLGSQYDNRASRSRLAGTVLSFPPSGRGIRIEARGLRNPYGLAFVPNTDALVISEHGRDDLGARRPPEEVNLVHTGGGAPHFGFPRCFNQGGTRCRGMRAPIALLAPHSAPGGVAHFPRYGAYGPSAYVVQFGSSFRSNPTGGAVVRVPLGGTLDNRRRTPERLAWNFKLQDALGIGAGRDGHLYVTRWQTGDVVRLVARRPR
jgi:glucose/arabinose dehydrogenase